MDDGSGQAVTVGNILGRTAAILSANAMWVVLFVLLFSALGAVADTLTAMDEATLLAGGGLLQLVVAIGSIVALYLLLETMLRTTGQFVQGTPRRYLAFLGQGILMSLGVVAGLLLLVIPGLILAARWSIAQPLLVGRGMSATHALGKSWEETRGHVVPIILAGIVLFVGFIFVAGAVIALLGEEDTISVIAVQLASNSISVISTAMTVALIGLINPPAERYSDIFG